MIIYKPGKEETFKSNLNSKDKKIYTVFILVCSSKFNLNSHTIPH